MSHPSAINRYNIFVFSIVTMTTDFFYTHYLFSLVDSSKLLIFLVNVLYNNETRYIQDCSLHYTSYLTCQYTCLHTGAALRQRARLV